MDASLILCKNMDCKHNLTNVTNEPELKGLFCNLKMITIDVNGQCACFEDMKKKTIENNVLCPNCSQYFSFGELYFFKDGDNGTVLLCKNCHKELSDKLTERQVIDGQD